MWRKYPDAVAVPKAFAAFPPALRRKFVRTFGKKFVDSIEKAAKKLVREHRKNSPEEAVTHKLFTVHKLNEQGFAKAEALAAEFTRTAEFLEANIPPSRELSLALTHLQDACFHAKRGIAEQVENQVPPPDALRTNIQYAPGSMR